MTQTPENAATHTTAAFFSLINHPVKFRLYLLKNLPSAFFSRLKILQANESTCTVVVSYRWFTKNPFRSTYFACLAMAAELSTGVLVMAQVFGRKPRISMLVTGLEARFYKKATRKTLFRCDNGDAVKQAVERAASTGVAQTIRVHTTGSNESQEPVAEFWITWSFKAK